MQRAGILKAFQALLRQRLFAAANLRCRAAVVAIYSIMAAFTAFMRSMRPHLHP